MDFWKVENGVLYALAKKRIKTFIKIKGDPYARQNLSL